MTVCDLSDLPESQCACRIHGPTLSPEARIPSRPRSRRYAPPVAFPARYPGTCDECREDIEPGDQIVSAGLAYVHAGRAP
jgi:hypothetical protein